MNTTIGRRLGIALALALAATPARPAPAGENAGSAPAPVYSEDFETTVPGQLPKGWDTVWGDAGDDLVAVTNDSAFAGEKCLRLERGGNPKPWGFGPRLTVAGGGVAYVRFAFRPQGPGTGLWFGMELRSADRSEKPLSALSLRNGKAYDNRRKPILTLANGDWHTVAVALPLGPDGGDTMTVEVANPRTGETGRAEVPLERHLGNLARICFNTQPERNHYTIDIDAFTVSVATATK